VSLCESHLQQAWRRRAQGVTQQLDQLVARLHIQRPQQRLATGRQRMETMRERLALANVHVHERATNRLAQLRMRLLSQQPAMRLKQLDTRNADLYRRLAAAWAHRNERHRQRLAELARALNAVSPLDVLKRGYAILFDDTGNVLRSVQKTKPGSRLRAKLADGELPLRVEMPNQH
jgi:exodeoxyribonuclease VII large subunit